MGSEVYFEDRHFASIHNFDEMDEGLSFLTSDESFIQVGTWNYEKNKNDGWWNDEKTHDEKRWYDHNGLTPSEKSYNFVNLEPLINDILPPKCLVKISLISFTERALSQIEKLSRLQSV